MADETAGAALERLEGIMARLRGPNGCPWDLKQTLETMRPHLLEEAYEVLEVMEAKDPAGAAEHGEELGDLMFQVVFQARLREEQGAFRLADVVAGIADKLVRRHPHVFGDVQAADADAAYATWDAMKRAEGKGRPWHVPRALPALMRADKVGKRAAREGFDWTDVDGPLAKVAEELEELREAVASGDRAAQEAEVGDLLFAVVNAARHLKVSSELALQATVGRFLGRYQHVVAALDADGRSVTDADDAELDRLWTAAKAALAASPKPETDDGRG